MTMYAPKNEVHITLCANGHDLSSDCWCEPNRIYWYQNQQGILMLVVEHNDETLKHRMIVLAERERDRDTNNGTGSDAPWVTRSIETALKEPPQC